MAKPNKTVAAFRRKNPIARTPRPIDPEFDAICTAVQNGEMSVEDAAAKIREISER